MKTNPDDSWYPNPSKLDEQCPHGISGGCTECRAALMASGRGVTIRLKLAADFAVSLVASWPPETHKGINDELVGCTMNAGLFMADTMLERANREEGSDDGK